MADKEQTAVESPSDDGTYKDWYIAGGNKYNITGLMESNPEARKHFERYLATIACGAPATEDVKADMRQHYKLMNESDPASFPSTITDDQLVQALRKLDREYDLVKEIADYNGIPIPCEKPLSSLSPPPTPLADVTGKTRGIS